jgi:hypothetical protein
MYEDEYGEILYTDVWKWKMRPVETIPGMAVVWKGRIKKNDGKGEFN